MRKLAMKEVMNDKSNELVEGLLDMYPSMRFVMKIDDALKARGLTQAKLATLTGLRAGTISELVSGSRLALTKTHIACVMIALRKTDIREIITSNLMKGQLGNLRKRAVAGRKKESCPRVSRSFTQTTLKLYTIQAFYKLRGSISASSFFY